MDSDYAVGDDLGPMPDILLVEDNPLHVRLVKSMLADIWDGAEGLRFAKRLDRAIEMVKDQEPDCILLDLVLPDAQDLEAVKAMLAIAPQIPIVVLSAHEDDEVAMQAVAEGAQDYLVKGTIGAEQLARSIHFAMQRHALDRPEESDAVAPVTVPEVPGLDAAGTAVIDRDGAVVYAEAAVADMLGLRLRDLVGVPLSELSYPSDVETFGSIAASGVGGEFDLQFRHGSGTSMRVRMELSPLSDGSQAGAAFIARYYPMGEVGTAASGAYTVITEWTQS
ncbi:MAG: response regulator [Acidimicrobiia bacterium]|nr:response regulator [Acidimicrobiia bacterium]